MLAPPVALCTVLVSPGESSDLFGVEIVAEIAMDGVAPALTNAVFHATGVRLRELPFTPQRVWHALRAAG